MHLTKEDIQKMERIRRLNIVNSVTGIKPANLIGTISNSGQPNLAIFSSVVHMSSNPPLLGFILRPFKEIRRHTYQNIMENGVFTINHVNHDRIEQSHYTSAKFEKDESEFEHCGFTEEYLDEFKAPFVKESHLKIGLRYIEGIPIKYNDTTLIIGEIVHLLIPDDAVDDEGHIDLDEIGTAGISGLNTYYGLTKLKKLPYARKSDWQNRDS